MTKLPGAKRFNADEHEEMGSFDALPAGDYHVKVSGNKKKDNKARTAALESGNNIPGAVYTVTFEILGGDYKGRLLFSGLNLEHTSDQTVEIAYKELTSITKACGKNVIEDLDELAGCEMMVQVKVVPETSQYPASNKIKKYSPLKGVARPSRPGAPDGEKKSKPKVSFD